MCRVCEPRRYPYEMLVESDDISTLDYRDELDFETGGICPFCDEAYGNKGDDENV